MGMSEAAQNSERPKSDRSKFFFIIFRNFICKNTRRGHEAGGRTPQRRSKF
jgi:hypothetical protein